MFGFCLGQSAWNKWSFHSFTVIPIPPSSSSHTGSRPCMPFMHLQSVMTSDVCFHDQTHTAMHRLSWRPHALRGTRDFLTPRCPGLYNPTHLHSHDYTHAHNTL